MTAPVITPGFKETVHDAQASFREVLDALSRPGTIRTLPAPLSTPASLSPALTAIILTLADYDTPIWLDEPTLTSGAAAYFAFHCGCRVTSSPDEAVFVISGTANRRPRLADLSQGTPEYPDRSATLLIDVGSFEQGADRVRLSGPGVRESLTVSIKAPDDRFWCDMEENHGRYPLGVDVILCADHQVIALPRSTKVERLSRQEGV